MQTTNLPIHDMSELDDYLAHVCEPRQMARHLDKLLYAHVYYNHREGIECDWEIYSDIHGMKQILESMNKNG